MSRLADDIAVAWIAVCRAIGRDDPARALALTDWRGSVAARGVTIAAVREAQRRRGQAPASPEMFRAALGLRCLSPTRLASIQSPSSIEGWSAALPGVVSAVLRGRP